MKSPVFFFALLLGTLQLSAQCLTLANCPTTPLDFGDLTINDPQFWQETGWYDPIYGTHDLAEMPVDLSLQITDNCATGNVQVSFVLFLNLDGSGGPETAIPSAALSATDTVYYGNTSYPNYIGGEPRAFDERPVPANQKYRFALEQSIQGNVVTAGVRWATAAAPGNYMLPQLPLGNHRIEWRVEKDGEIKTCSYDFVVRDTKPPTVVCLNGLSVNVLPSMLIQLWASDFLQYGQDNITPTPQLQYAIRRSGTGTGFPVDANGGPISSVIFTCADIGTQPVELWVRDAVGNADFCETYVIVQDNNHNCDGNAGPYTVCIKPGCTNIPLTQESVTFEISGSNPAVPSFYFLVDLDQSYCTDFGSFPIAPDNIITPHDDSPNPLSGVTNYNLLLLSRHILGIEPFTQNEQFVAADTDLNGIIDSADLIHCRQLQLGFEDSVAYPGFRFYPLDFVFPAGNPLALPIPDHIVLDSAALSKPIVFVAVKTCNFNCTGISGIDETVAAPATIGQPQPNPTAAGVLIPISLPQSAAVAVEILDLTGRLLYHTTGTYAAGEQQIEVPPAALPQSGFYFWRAQAGSEFRSGKLVKQ